MNSFDPEPLSDIAPLALLFHESSKINRSSAVSLAERVGEWSGDVDSLRRAATGAKTYPGAKRVDLRKLRRVPRLREPLETVLERRRSVRSFASRSLAVSALGAILTRACGTTGEVSHPEHAEITQPLRANPSGGALYPVETYIAAMEVEGLEPGIWHHHAPQSCLEAVRIGAPRDRLEPWILTVSGKLDARVAIILAGRWERPLSKYGERGYRVMLLDAGHAAQNILLAAAALGIGACPIAGFHDDALAAELGLDAREEPVLCVITLGYPSNGIT